MAVITSCGTYVPYWRLPREVIGRAWNMPSIQGERAVAGGDEDSITMAVEAGSNALAGMNPGEIDGIFFATTTPPYRQKQCAVTIAAALDLPPHILTADFANGLRAATAALRAACDVVKSGAARNILVVAADCRPAEPETQAEQLFGDAAAAVVVSAGGTGAVIEKFSSVNDEFIGTWRTEKDCYPRSFETKHELSCGYVPAVTSAVGHLFQETGLGPQDFHRAAVAAPDLRGLREVIKRLGIDPRQTAVQDPLLDKVGDVGAGQPLLLLAAALEQAREGERVLLASWGEGSDAFSLVVNGRVRCGRSLTYYLATKKVLESYGSYLKARQLWGRETCNPKSSPVVYWRDRRELLNFYGARCRLCGTVQYPPGRACFSCGAKDQSERVRLAKRGHVFTYTLDHLVYGDYSYTPVPRLVVDLEGGGRVFLEGTDCDPQEIRIDLPVELVLRIVHRGGGFHNYYWKCRPVRERGANG